MNAVRQSCRPKHQVLILKCYPKYQKGALDVRPNASELSYLLYYASTRRSKVQKVGVFLEKRTARDVWRGKTGNVIVTLHILQALIEKCPADLPLYADSVLTILDSVLRSNDLNLVEESIGPFSAFCKFQDPNLLAAEHAFVNHYRNVVRTYASFASDDPASARSASNATATVATASRNSPSLSVLLRWKTAGLRAIQAVVSIDDLGTDVMNQLDIVLPPLLENIYTYSFANHSAGINEKNNRNQSDINHARIQALEEAEREISSSRHRGSLRTIDSQEATDAASYATATAHEEAQHADQAIHTLADTTAAATATATAVADAANGNASDDENNSQKAAETAVRALALGCLQRIYATASNTGHIRNATSQILRFIVARQPDWTTGSVITPPYATTESTDAPTWIHSAPPCSLSPAGAGGSAVAGCSWGRHLLAIIARSTPVQNRFIILLAAMESLLNTPMSTRKMPAQLMLASLVDGLLSGPNNLIGLSVMDVLIGLLQHLLLLLRVTAGKTKRVLHRQTTSGFIRYSLTGVDGDGVVRGKQNQGGGVPKRTALKNENDGAQSHQRSRSITLTDEDAISDPERRAELANSLQLCIGHLATHIYYADQVSDIIAMILSRVKPATSIMELSDSSAEADANANADVSAGKDAASSSSPVVTTNGTVSPDHEQERLFAFPESQISALRSVKNVLCVANSRSSPSVGPAGIPTITTSESRNKVPISAWEDTQWMISDTDVGVQIGYIDALVTWLNSETTADDLRVVESRKKALGITAANLHGGGASALNPLTVGAAAARPLTANFSAATSGHGNDTSYCGGNGNPSDSSERLYRTIADTVTAAHRDQVASVASQFLSLLHIAVYDSVSTVSGDGDVAEEQNILRLHLALATLVDKLGVNAIRHGLPMIMRLQDEFVVADQAAATITTEGRCERSISKAARVMAGSLVHGYLLAIVQRFELYSSSVGREITREIERRKNEDCWLCAVSIPPLSLGEIDELGKRQGEKGGWALGVPEIAILHPFTNVGGLADLIEESYNAAAAQSFHPSSLDGTTLARPSTATSTHSKSQQRAYQAHALIQPLPASVRESMTMPWTKESALAAIEANDPNLQSSLSGSRTNTNLGLSTGVGRAYLSEALGHRHGAPSSASVGRLRAGTALSSVDTPSSVNPADDAAARRSVSVRDGRSGQMSGLARRGSMPDEHRLSVGTTYTIRMDELRHALSVSNAESRDKLTAVPKQQRCQSAGHASNLTGRRESSSISSTYSDHPSLVSAHSGLPPTGGVGLAGVSDPRQYSEHLQTIESIPPVPPIPPDYHTPSASQSSISRPNTARASPTNGGLAPPQAVKTRPNTVNGVSSSYPSSPSSKRVSAGGKRLSSVTSVRTATQPTNSCQDEGKQTGSRARHSSSVRSDRTLSLGRRADVERLINGLLDHANQKDSGDPLDYDDLGTVGATRNTSSYVSTVHQQQANLAQSKARNGSAAPQCPAINTSVDLLGFNRSAPITPVMKTPVDNRTTTTTTIMPPGRETSAGGGSETGAMPGSGDSAGVLPNFFHDDADFHLRTPLAATSPQQQHHREQRAALLASLGSRLSSVNRDNVVRPPY